MSYECSLHGRISNNLKPQLIDRLIGIFKTTEGPSRNEDVLLRLKSHIDENDLTKRQWQLFQLGHPESHLGRSTTDKPATVRAVFHSKIHTGDSLKFMGLLGYKMGFEFARKGIVFNYHDNLKIIITQIFKLEKPNDVSSLIPFDPKNYWIVEVSTVPILQQDVEKNIGELRKFAEMLKGILNLHYIEHSILQNKVHH
ncbi:14633_t:CDS:2 [Entrophospora sp. SA101]|nr:1708_t:CDS:2 [Entrophospora candida]CAH1761862.1 15162_t:CDS:2 [Entrophospora sp. SA101]CAJ0745048.1 13768_t:CDS:2 [Entrophospora sp. SA101]CAJ0748675.1 907_t:CDS:2 [Entrophospora sp. SA101]CAJ0756496.1 14633_t:CDS:2 [Entrophospora sp. SA101]